MLKKFIVTMKAAWRLAAPITHIRLMELGFDYQHPFYMLTDLAIELDIKTGHFFYVDEEGNRKRIKVMRDISDLIYGVVRYGQ